MEYLTAARISLFAITFFFLSCVNSSTNADEIVKVSEWKLHLVERGLECWIVCACNDEANKLVLSPQPPCRFVGETGSPQVVKSLSSDDRAMLVVFGTPYSGKLPNRFAAEGLYCGTVSQAVMITSETVSLSNRVAKGGLRCEGKKLGKREFELFDAEN